MHAAIECLLIELPGGSDDYLPALLRSPARAG
jgi:hypothetical protein